MSTINLLCIGDVVGRPGRYVLSQALTRLVHEHQIECVIANVENAAGGSGLTPLIYEKISRYGVNLMTLGDHIYKRKEIFPVLESAGNIVKPANLPETAPGKPYAIYQSKNGHKIAIMALMGRLFMNMPTDSPFTTIDGLLSVIPADVKIKVVDIHAEATSEKIALGWYLDGRVSCIFGTHTHIPTADEQILPNGTAYITDVGMTGPYDSVLGRRKDRVVFTMRTGIPSPFDVAQNDPTLCGIIVKVDPESGKAIAIERIRLKVNLPDDAEKDGD